MYLDSLRYPPEEYFDLKNANLCTTRRVLAFMPFIPSPGEFWFLLHDSFEERSDVCFIKRPDTQEIFNILFANCRHYNRMVR